MYVDTGTASGVWAVVLIACLFAIVAGLFGEGVAFLAVGVAAVGYAVWWWKA